MQQVVHFTFHLIAPFFIALFFYPKNVVKSYLILLATMLVDLDHLLAVPVYDPNRCSIGYHPLHSYYAIGIYILLLLPVRTRLIAIGLLFHMLTDGMDFYIFRHL